MARISASMASLYVMVIVTWYLAMAATKVHCIPLMWVSDMCFFRLYEPLLCGAKYASTQGDRSGRTKPPVDFITKVPLWSGLAWPGQVKAERVL